jgi:hypothetical protein
MSRLLLVGILVVCAACGSHALRGRKDAAVNLPDSIAVDDLAVSDLSPETVSVETLSADAASEGTVREVGSGAGAIDTSDTMVAGDTAGVDFSMDVASIDVADAAAGDALDSGPACVANPPAPPDTPSRQTVRFHFASRSSGFLVSRGYECSPITVARYAETGATSLTLDLLTQILCEGPVPPSPGPASAVALSQPGGPVLTWDARELEAHKACVDCSSRGWTGMPSFPVTVYARVPVAAGHYRATFAVLDSLPSACSSADGITANCNTTYGSFYAIPSNISLCPSSRSLAVEFDLPVSGDLDVTVTDAS